MKARRCGRSWLKPIEGAEITAIKEIDPSIFEDGSTGIPGQIYDRFPCVQELELDKKVSIGKGQKIVYLVYKGIRYSCDLTKKAGKRGEKITNTVVLYFEKSLVEVFKSEFKTSWEYIQREKSANQEKRKERAQQTGKIAKCYLKLSDEYLAYIEFYKLEADNEYEIKCITDKDYLKNIEIIKSEGEEVEIEDMDELVQYRNENIGIDYIKDIQRYTAEEGIQYSLATLSNFYLSLKSKPFTILAGISGTGKSKLVRLFAQAIDADFTLIPVKPDWSDATDLLGYRDLNQQYQEGRFIEVIRRASEEPEKPYIICLDEMNLARVEYYFSDFLSLIESRRKDGDRIITDTFSGEDIKQYIIPDNVYIVGTVNMDETTFQFSKKVLDRANTIELSEVNLAYDFDAVKGPEVQVEPLHNDALKSKYLLLKDCKEHRVLATRVIDQLIAINEILIPCGLEFAYRVRDEIVFYMIYNAEYQLLDEHEAFDFQLLQKVLPRISGTSEQIRILLLKLLDFCLEEQQGVEALNDIALDETEIIEQAVYKKSAKKILNMLRRCEDGFTSFW